MNKLVPHFAWLAVCTFPLIAHAWEPKPEFSKFDFNDLKSLLTDNKDIRSVDQLLPKLPASYRKYYTVVYTNRSRQGGSPLSPRVISFGAPLAGSYPYQDSHSSTRNDYLIMAFKTDPSQKIGLVPDEDDLEVLEYLPAQKNWVAHDVTFPSRASNSAELTDAERFQVSKDNPEECIACHRQDIRPNWEAYPRWPGVFGSNAGPYYLNDEKQEALAERSALRLFVDGDATHSPIRQLPRFQALDPYPYKTDGNGSDGKPDYLGSEELNINITAKLAKLNFIRAARMIHESPLWAKYKYAIYASFDGCPDFQTFLSDDTLKSLSKDYAPLAQETKSVMDLPFFHFKLFEWEFDRDAQNVADMRFLFEGQSIPGQIPTIDPWFMNFDPNQYRTNSVSDNFTAGVGAELDPEFWNDPVVGADGRLYATSGHIEPRDSSACAKLKTISLALQHAN